MNWLKSFDEKIHREGFSDRFEFLLVAANVLNLFFGLALAIAKMKWGIDF